MTFSVVEKTLAESKEIKAHKCPLHSAKLSFWGYQCEKLPCLASWSVHNPNQDFTVPSFHRSFSYFEFPCSSSSCCTRCSEHASPTAAITLKWHHSFQPSLLAQRLCWIDGTRSAAWSSPTPDKESLTELHLLVWMCCRRTVLRLSLCYARLFLFVLSLHIYHRVSLFADAQAHTFRCVHCHK